MFLNSLAQVHTWSPTPTWSQDSVVIKSTTSPLRQQSWTSPASQSQSWTTQKSVHHHSQSWTTQARMVLP